uniref:Uncharacterized protein n=1 Tax=Rhizophora mucronata TaxID=61149 RepID=A0A2P2PJL2_RHIMU
MHVIHSFENKKKTGAKIPYHFTDHVVASVKC